VPGGEIQGSVQGLSSCVGQSGTLLALDWQHTSYRFAPQEVGGPGQPAWPLSPYPDGDYFIFALDDDPDDDRLDLLVAVVERFLGRRSAGQARR
jgi:hypothetical protein